MKSVFRSTCIISLVLAAGFISTGCAKRPPTVLTQQEMKKLVVARVNGVELYMDALDKMMKIMSAGTPTASSPASRNETRNMALDQLVLRELVLQQAARQGLSVGEQDISHAMDNLIMSLGHEQGFRDYLEKQKTTEEEVRAQVAKSLLLQLAFNKEVLNKISVSDDDARKEYEQHKDQYGTPEKPMPFEEAKDRIDGKLKAAAQQKRIREWEQELKKDAKIELMEEGGGQGPAIMNRKADRE